MGVGTDGIFNIVNQANEARLLTVAWRFFDIAAALFLPVFMRHNLDIRLLIFEILLCKSFTCFEQYREFSSKRLAYTRMRSALDSLLCLSENFFKGATCQKMNLHLFRFLICAKA